MLINMKTNSVKSVSDTQLSRNYSIVLMYKNTDDEVAAEMLTYPISAPC